MKLEQDKGLEQENRRLQRHIQSLMDRIEANQRIQQRYHELELHLLSCTNLGDLLHTLLVGALERFELDAISLVLYDPDYSTRELLNYLDKDIEIDDYGQHLQLRHSAEFVQEYYAVPVGGGAQDIAVTLGALDGVMAARLFPGVSVDGASITSAARLPLMRQLAPLGSLHLGSCSPTRFSSDKATDFMCHLAQIVAVCLENCLAREHLHRQGQVDMLTQVSNRRNFDTVFAKELARSDRSGEPLSCMFVDVDHFKRINDNYGHLAGDLCLKGVAQRIQLQLRKTDLLARYGGEEFVVLLPRSQAREAIQIAERVRRAIEDEPLPVEANEECEALDIPVTASIGVCSWLPEDERVGDLSQLGKQLLKAADTAMYDAKQGGRNLVCVRDLELFLEA